MPRRLAVAGVVAFTLCASLAGAAASQAAPGALQVLVTGNDGADATDLAAAIAAQPGVAQADPFDTSLGTPTAGQIASRDLVVSIGDSDYADAALWGNRLADYVDGGGAVLQTAYDNWNNPPPGSPAPTGRFASGGYPPLALGPNQNTSVTLGQILVPDSPLVQGLGTFPSTNNTTTPLAPGATLLAKWSDGRNAIAVKGRVVATSATGSENGSFPALARLARNTANFIRRHRLTVTRHGAGTGTVTSAPAGILCGSDCVYDVPFGERVTLTAAAGARSAFIGWGERLCTGTGPCITTVPADTSIAAFFASLARCGNPQSGTARADSLTGTRFPDRLRGLAGADAVRGLEGADCLDGGAGNDKLNGHSGPDSLTGGSGRDRLSGGSGNDKLNGGSSADRLSGGTGKDRLRGGSGNDRLSGGSAKDVLVGGKGKNILSGGSGNDVLDIANGRRDRAGCGTVEALPHVLLDPSACAPEISRRPTMKSGLTNADRRGSPRRPRQASGAALVLDPVDRQGRQEDDGDGRGRPRQRALVRPQIEQADEGARRAVWDWAGRLTPRGRLAAQALAARASRGLPSRARLAGSLSQPLAPEGCGSGITMASSWV